MPYINIETMEYPLFDGDLKLLGWSEEDPIPDNFRVVEWTDPPTIEEDSVYFEVSPVEENGIWKICWDIRPMTDSEIAFKNTPYPNDGKRYIWDQEALHWKIR